MGVFISIHAPREGCDLSLALTMFPANRFQSTHPVRGATLEALYPNAIVFISIHAPREGCDPGGKSGWYINPYFNPRTP